MTAASRQQEGFFYELPERYALPDDTRVYAIGDIHGHLGLLDALHEQIKGHAKLYPVAHMVIIYLGDYIDRGPDSAGVMTRLIENPMQGFERVLLKGNHEVGLEGFLKDPGVWHDWLRWGGMEALESYGVPVNRDIPLKIQASDLSLKLAKAMPDSHKRLLDKMVLYHQTGGFAFVHAGIRPGVPLDEQTEEDLTFIRSPFLETETDFGYVVIHGHTITDIPDMHQNRIGIDTGAYKQGILTCAVIENNRCQFIKAGQDDLT